MRPPWILLWANWARPSAALRIAKSAGSVKDAKLYGANFRDFLQEAGAHVLGPTPPSTGERADGCSSRAPALDHRQGELARWACHRRGNYPTERRGIDRR